MEQAARKKTMKKVKRTGGRPEIPAKFLLDIIFLLYESGGPGEKTSGERETRPPLPGLNPVRKAGPGCYGYSPSVIR
jgi:hypothetical protein